LYQLLRFCGLFIFCIIAIETTEDRTPPGKDLLDKVDWICGSDSTAEMNSDETSQSKSRNHVINPTCKSSEENQDNHRHHPTNHDQIYQCSDCDLKFTSKFAKSRHKKIVHEKELPFRCKVRLLDVSLSLNCNLMRLMLSLFYS